MDEVKLKRSEYEALRSWAADGVDGEAEPALQALVTTIDRRNKLQRYTVVIAWTALPESGYGTVLGGARKTIELSHAPTKADIFTALAHEHYHESSVLVTADPNGAVGWYDLEHFPWA